MANKKKVEPEPPKEVTVRLDGQLERPVTHWIEPPKEFRGMSREQKIEWCKQNSPFWREALALEIKTDADEARAIEMCRVQGAWEKSVDAFWDEGRQKSYDTWNWITSTIAAMKWPMQVREHILDAKRKEYIEAKDRARKAEEDRLRREQEEKNRREQEAERERLRQAQEEADRLRREGEVRKARELQERTRQEAEERARQFAASVPAITPGSSPSPEGSQARPWEAEVTDVRLAIAAIAQGKTPLTKEEVDELMGRILPDVKSRLNKLAKRMGKEDIGVPGAKGKCSVNLRVYQETRKPTYDGWEF